MAQSNMEAELLAAYSVINEVTGLRNLVLDLEGLKQTSERYSIQVWSDSMAMIKYIAKNVGASNKHIDIKLQQMRVTINRCLEVKLDHVTGHNNVADVCMKSVDARTYSRHTCTMGLRTCLSSPFAPQVSLIMHIPTIVYPPCNGLVLPPA